MLLPLLRYVPAKKPFVGLFLFFLQLLPGCASYLELPTTTASVAEPRTARETEQFPLWSRSNLAASAR
ncbi:MAG: hypothetical protein ACM3ZQ_11980 [Bacillota bacterium]